MQILIVGAGASGITAAINIKRKHPDYNVLIIEQLDKPLKKLLATGNGKCNLGNANILIEKYNNPNFVNNFLKNYNYKEFFETIHVKTKLIGDLAYPISESAISVRDAFLNEIKKLKIDIHCNEYLINYKVSDKIKITTNVATYTADKLILAGGGKSSPKLGSDGSIFKILEEHGYSINPLNPGLSPIMVKENLKLLDGIRNKSNVKININNKTIFDENGEVLFKNHGLSGIVIFNAMSAIARCKSNDIKIKIDLIPDFSNEYLNNYLLDNSIDDLLISLVHPKLIDYLKSRFHGNEEVLKSLKNLEFNYSKSYGFDFSQVTIGGINISDLDSNLMSKIEKNVYIIGEMLDVDGPCGGYNLTWAFASALNL